jgi:hypothetical protein
MGFAASRHAGIQLAAERRLLLAIMSGKVGRVRGGHLDIGVQAEPLVEVVWLGGRWWWWWLRGL